MGSVKANSLMYKIKLGTMVSNRVFMRSRIKVALCLLAVIGLGLASRKFPDLFPELFGKYPGDTLWSIAVYFGWAILLPNTESIKLATLALATSFLVELSQIYHVPWLDEIRSNAIGHLFLGSTFNVIDLVAYSVGVIAIFVIDLLLLKRNIFAHSA
jgi:hypothetical protein